MIGWFTNNSEWLLSGVGGSILVAAASWILNRFRTPNQNQSSGDNSVNIQAGKDVHIVDKQ